MLQSLRQVLVELRRLADNHPSSSFSNSTPPKPFKLVTFPSDTTTGKSPIASPVLKSDLELRRSSPKARVAPFWGPGLPPRTSSDSEPGTSNSTHHQDATSSILTRLHQLCSGQGNLRTSARDEDTASSGSSTASSGSTSKLWTFDTNMSQAVLTSMFYKRLCWRLGACSAKESLIAEALQASSTGKTPLPSEWMENGIALVLCHIHISAVMRTHSIALRETVFIVQSPSDLLVGHLKMCGWHICRMPFIAAIHLALPLSTCHCCCSPFRSSMTECRHKRDASWPDAKCMNAMKSCVHDAHSRAMQSGCHR